MLDWCLYVQCVCVCYSLYVKCVGVCSICVCVCKARLNIHGLTYTKRPWASLTFIFLHRLGEYWTDASVYVDVCMLNVCVCACKARLNIHELTYTEAFWNFLLTYTDNIHGWIYTCTGSVNFEQTPLTRLSLPVSQLKGCQEPEKLKTNWPSESVQNNCKPIRIWQLFGSRASRVLLET